METTKRKRIPFKGLSVVSAVCRHKSFTAAARELHVTPSAVSKKIAEVEAQLGLILFTRLSGVVEPSETAFILAAAFDQARDMLASVIDEVQPQSPETTIRVAVPTTFAMRWLIPRLWHLLRQHPHIRVDVIPTHSNTPLPTIDYDVAIRQANPDHRPEDAVHLFSEKLGLLAKPALVQTIRNQRKIDLSAITLIASESRPRELENWIAQSRRQVRLSRERKCFHHFYIALEAALAAEGAVVGPVITLSEIILRGELMEPLPEYRIPGPEIFAFHAPGRRPRDAELKFIRWLCDQSKEASPEQKIKRKVGAGG